MDTFFSHGKLLLTGEYVVLDGALSLATPTEAGQSLIIEAFDEPLIIWKSVDDTGKTWYEHEFAFDDIDTKYNTRGDELTARLLDIFYAAKQLNPKFLTGKTGYQVATLLDFPRDWGLGTSSTLINNIANWAQVDAYKLLELTFGGSGYDIACAQNFSALSYKIEADNSKTVTTVDFDPEFKEALYFVYLNKKQNSRDGIAQYRKNSTDNATAVAEISAITTQIIACTTLETFNSLIDKHEAIIAKLIQQTPVKKLHFNDFHGSIKSLGAWGGDFVLATSSTDPTDYFKAKGFETVIPYNEMVVEDDILSFL